MPLLKPLRSIAVAVLLAPLLFPAPSLAEEADIRRSLSAEPDTLDPHKAGLKASWSILRDLFEGLTRVDPMGQPVPGAAEGWDVSEDGLTWRFALREEIYWSDGTRLTAEDFVAGFRRLFDPETASKSAFMLYVIENARDVVAGRRPPKEIGVSAEDARTVTIRLEHPAPKLPVLLAAPFAAPAPRHLLNKDWPSAAGMVSNGAYTLINWIPNSRIGLTKNAEYWMSETVQAQRVDYIPITDEATALWRLRADELDIVGWFSLPQMRWLKDNLPKAVHTEPALFVTYLVFNTEVAPFDDVRIRKAASLAIDRTILTEKVLQTGDAPSEHFVPDGVSEYTHKTLPQEAWPMDKRRTEALRLLADLGHGPENPVSFTFRVRAGDDERRVAIAIAQMWKPLGLEAAIQSTDLSSHYGDIEQGNFQIADAGWSVFDAPELFLDLMRSDTGALNYGRYASPEFDATLARGLETPDIQKRHDLFAQAEQIMLDDQAVAPLFFNVARYVVAPTVKGFKDNAADIHLSQYLTRAQ